MAIHELVPKVCSLFDEKSWPSLFANVFFGGGRADLILLGPGGKYVTTVACCSTRSYGACLINAGCNQFFAQYSYMAVSQDIRKKLRGNYLREVRSRGLGLIVVKDEAVKIEIPARRSEFLNRVHYRRLKQFLKESTPPYPTRLDPSLTFLGSRQSIAVFEKS